MDQVAIVVPYAFIAPKVRLTWREVQFGIAGGIFSASDAVDVAIESLARGDMSNSIIRLVSMAIDDPIMDAVVELADAEPPQGLVDIQRLWAYLLLAWVFQHRDQYDDPLDMAEKVYADLDYPENVASFIRYMPSDDPDLGCAKANEDRLFQKWERYMDDELAYFRSRNIVDN